ncbi:MAG: TolC family protein [Muribaculaceae bacterium]|nr:TolC family protein [Muribaculaceae bacterium]
MTRVFATVIMMAMLLAPGIQARGESRVMTLDEVIDEARKTSVEAQMALNSMRASYWSYRNYRASLLPEISFSATLPSFSQRYSSYQNPDGTYDFIHSSVLEAGGQINITQNIWATGGTLSMSTSLNFLRQMGRNAYSRFMSVPVALRLDQPIFAANSAKQTRKTAPLQYRAAQIDYIVSTENLARTAMGLYFDLIIAREQVEIQQKNLENAKKLHEIAKVKREMGKISQNEVLQLELNALNAQSALTSAESGLTAASFELTSFLGYEEDFEIIPQIPDRLPHIDVTFSEVYEMALRNSTHSISRRLSELAADYSVASAKGNMRRIDLYAQVGFTGTGDNITGAYSPLQNNEVVSIGVQIPLVDWGKRRGQVKVAESNREVTLARLRQEDTQFRQNIFLLVDRFNSQQRQVEIASVSDTIAQRRYDTNVASFMMGKISTLDLDNSQTAKDNQRISYLTQLYQYWSYYYQIRSLTLHDFITHEDLFSVECLVLSDKIKQ